MISLSQVVLVTEESRCAPGPSVTARCPGQRKAPHTCMPAASRIHPRIIHQNCSGDKVQRCANDKSMFAQQKGTVSSEWIENGRTKGRLFQPLRCGVSGVWRAHKSPGETAGFVADGARVALLGLCWFGPAGKRRRTLITYSLSPSALSCQCETLALLLCWRILKLKMQS